jgi:hypothetical protein
LFLVAFGTTTASHFFFAVGLQCLFSIGGRVYHGTHSSGHCSSTPIVVNVQNLQLRQFCQIGGDGARDFISTYIKLIEHCEGTQLGRNFSRQASVVTTKNPKTRQTADSSGDAFFNFVVVQPNFRQAGQFA